jgi:LPXTG-motif cell wall-anchored protein
LLGLGLTIRFSHMHGASSTVSGVLAFLLAAPPPDRWANWRWLATADERVLWATLAGAALLAVLGAWVGWKNR